MCYIGLLSIKGLADVIICHMSDSKNCKGRACLKLELVLLSLVYVTAIRVVDERDLHSL